MKAAHPKTNELKPIDGDKKTLTEKDLEDLKKYARKCFYSHNYLFCNVSFEDLYHDFICVAIEKGTTKGIASSVLYRYTCCSEAVEIKTAKPFSALTSVNGRTGEVFDGLDAIPALQCYDNYFFDNEFSTDCIFYIASYLYSNSFERFERFLDYINGMPLRGDSARTIREKLFRHAPELLQILLSYDKISYNDFIKYNNLLSTMSNYAPQKRKLMNTSSHNNVRKYYERHKEKRKAYMRERYQRLKAEKTLKS